MAILKSTRLIIFVFLCALGFAVLVPSVGFAAEESITVTTYYPSPYGVYSEMRLYPKAPPPPLSCSSSNEGTMYYDNVEHTMKVCRCTNPPGCTSFDYGWQPASTYWTLTGTYLSTNSPSWNVGIGTATPSAKLEVWGSGVGSDLARLRIRSADNQAGIFMFSDNTGEVGMYSPDGTDNLHLWAGGDRVVVLNNGNIGMGQSPGNARLHLNGNGMAGGANDYNIFAEYGGAALFNVKNSGNVGIGTVNPDTKLVVMSNNVGGADRANQMVIKGLSNQNLKLNMGIHTEASPPFADIGFVEEAVAWRNIVLAKNGGNVGIGTPGPSYKLDVAGYIRSSSGGFIFPDNTVQTTASGGGSFTKVDCTFSAGSGGWKWCGCPAGYYATGWAGYNCESIGGKWGCVGTAGYTNGVYFGTDGFATAYTTVYCAR